MTALKAKTTFLGVGRPRSEDASASVQQVALDLAHQGGMANATVEKIARKSGVAKTTIYRRWPNAAAIVMDAFLQDMSPLIEYRIQPTLKQTFASTLKQFIAALNGPRGVLLRNLLGAAQADADLQSAFQKQWIGPRRDHATKVLADARNRGDLAPHVHGDVLIDSLYGAIYYRLMIPYADLSDEYVDRLIDQIFAGVSES